jgi:hypothetical protein
MYLHIATFVFLMNSSELNDEDSYEGESKSHAHQHPKKPAIRKPGFVKALFGSPIP